jgi:AraC-like DNA-binding protein
MRSRASDSKTPAASRDSSEPLAAIISLLRPRTVLAKVVTGRGTWSTRYEAYRDPAFALVLEGSCFMDVDGVGVLELRAGDFVLLPQTPAFTLASELGITPRSGLPTSAREVHHGLAAGPLGLRLLGGYFRFDPANARLLLSLLPSAVHIRRGELGAERLRRIAELIGEEASTALAGRELILERLVEVLLIEALRFRSASVAKQEQGLLAGLADRALARPLHGIHVDVARRWTVAELARTAGMSRAVFAERFARTVGMPPMQYLLEWRMALAKDALRRERPSLAELAERMGYQSASAFSTAFARSTGCSPSEFARAGRQDGANEP